MRLELNSADMLSIRSDFDTEVYKTTQSLITALAALQRFDLSSPNRFISNMDVSLDIEGVNVEELEESTEQLIYRGWITSIIRTWEIYRSKMANQGFSEIVENNQIQHDVIGDLNKIRNAFTHGSKIGRDSPVKNCKILKWFKPSDRIILTILHVFEFLHHFDLLHGMIIRIKKDDANQSDCKLAWLIKKDSIWRPVGRKVISIKDSGTDDENPNKRFICVLFDNGLFGSFYSSEIGINSFKTVEINNSNLKFDNKHIIRSNHLYRILLRKFPNGPHQFQTWSFKASEDTQLTLPATKLNANVSAAKVVEVYIE